jgi:hypothetical protein
MILYLKDPKTSTKTLLDNINRFSKVAGCKINLQKSVAFLYNNNEHIKKEYGTILYTTVSKNQISRNGGCERPL